jgi:chemotaxis signal transduction protein
MIIKPRDLIQNTEMPVTNSFTAEDRFVVFTLDRNDFAIPAGIIDRIIRSIYITGVPGMHENILGMINVHGQAIPVFNIRKIFNLPGREIQLNDLYIIIRISGQIISIVVDSVKGMTNRKDQKMFPAGKIFEGMEKIFEGLIFFEDGMILIYDPEKIFKLEKISGINMEALGQKMKEIQDTGEKARKKTPGQDNKTVKGKEVKTQTDKIQKKTAKQMKDASGRLKTRGSKKVK